MKNILLILLITVLASSCTKNFLDKKPDQALVVPQTLQDFQALLDNTNVMNLNMPSLGEISSDDYYVTDAGFQSVTVPIYANAYTWNKDIYVGSPDIVDWNNRYQQIFYSNVVLEGLDKLSAADKKDSSYFTEKGSALFYRAFALYQLSQLFCKPYNPVTSGSDPGVPVRTSSDINQKSIRGTVTQSYNQVITDLQNSLNLLPQSTAFKTRPNLAAACSLLARVYLIMGDYANALNYSDKALKLYSTLSDYNQLSASAAHPFVKYNDEVIFHCTLYGNSFSNVSRLLIDTNLYSSYQQNDLRLPLFFTTVAAGHSYKGSYSGSSTFFGGIATDELFLIRAECYARMNNTSAALADLNTLMITRFKTGTFIPFAASDAGDALNLILAERRKELLYRGLRWTDLRRLNLESGRAVNITRKLNGTVYSLPANDPRYILPIPDLVIQLSGIAQNPR